MKQKDVALIIFVAALSGLVAFFVATKLIVTPANRQQQVEVVDVLSSTFNTPDERFFNESSINPAHTGTNSAEPHNDNPFNKTN